MIHTDECTKNNNKKYFSGSFYIKSFFVVRFTIVNCCISVFIIPSVSVFFLYTEKDSSTTESPNKQTKNTVKIARWDARMIEVLSDVFIWHLSSLYGIYGLFECVSVSRPTGKINKSLYIRFRFVCIYDVHFSTWMCFSFRLEVYDIVLYTKISIPPGWSQ